jgi:branched-chain amino acid transport system permease protein
MAYTVTTKSHASRIASIAGLLLIIVYVALPLFAGRSTIQDMFFILTMLVLAQFWNLLAGYGGLVSKLSSAWAPIRSLVSSSCGC